MARATVKSDAELARRIGAAPQTLHAYRKGKRHISAAHVAALCNALELPGEKAREWLARIEVEQAAERHRPLMQKAFFGYWARGVVPALGT